MDRITLQYITRDASGNEGYWADNETITGSAAADTLDDVKTGEIWRWIASNSEIPEIDATLYVVALDDDGNELARSRYTRKRQQHTPAELARLIRRTGMRKAALAEACGKTPCTISNYLAGRSPIPPLVWDRIEEFAERRKQ